MKYLIPFCVFWGIGANIFAQNQTVGLFTLEVGSYEGYTLFAPLRSSSAYLIDNCGRLINEWVNDKTPGNTVIITPTGHLLRTELIPNPVMNVGGIGGRIELADWEGNVTWEFTYSDSLVAQHHEALMLPNGNILLLAIERIPIEEAFALGRNPALTNVDYFWPELIVEIQPIGADSGAIVWEWHIWDHIVQDFDSLKPNYGAISDHPELIDLNFTFSTVAEDWLHANAIDYNAELDQIILSLRNTNEFYIIDHSTTSEEAASHTGGNSGKGGDFLYRWGNPQIYRRGTAADQILFGQHHVHWVEPGMPDYGKILAFNNGALRPDSNYATIDLINPPVDSAGNYTSPGDSAAFGPDTAEWALLVDIPMKYPAGFLGSSQQLPNKNMLICHGPDGIIYEVDSVGNLVWHYVIPVGKNGPYNQGDSITNASVNSLDNRTFRSIKYSGNFPGFVGKDFSAGNRIEGNPLPFSLICNTDRLENWAIPLVNIYPNPAEETIYIQLPDMRPHTFTIKTILGQPAFGGKITEGTPVDISRLPAGIYFVELWAPNDTFPKVGKFVKQ